MGRYINPSVDADNLTANYVDSSATYNDDGFLTAYTANNISYTSITYADAVGAGSEYGKVYKRVASYVETNTINNSSQTVTVNYDDTTGRVSSLSIT